MFSYDKLNLFLASETFYSLLREGVPSIGDKINDDRIYMMFTSILMSIRQDERGDTHLDDYLNVLKRIHEQFGLTGQHAEIGKQAFAKAIEIGGKDLSDEETSFLIDGFNRLSDQVLSAK